MNKCSYSIILLLSCLFSWQLQAQKAYPISILTQAMPPHSGVLSDFVAPGLNKMAVTLVLNDANELSYQVRLRLTIEGPGITIQTNPNAVFNPIALNYGVPAQVISADLMPYFDLNNLVFSGITKQQYLDQGSLPDGLYNFCFEAVDYDRFNEDPASARSCALINAVINDPPVVLSPIGATLTSDPQQLAIQWQAMHTGTFPTQYDLQVFEYPEGSSLTIDQIFDYHQPFFQKTLMGATTAIVSVADPPLTRGQRYLIRVRVRDITNIHFFKNQGWSEYQEFYYGEACQPPVGLQIVSSDPESVKLAWSPPAGYATFLVRYRNASIPGAPWYEDETSSLQHTISGLTVGASYEFQVQSLCGGNSTSTWSPSINYSIEDPVGTTGDFECGDAPSVTMPSALYPITNLNLGDVVQIGNFDMIIGTVTKNGDVYAGKGTIFVPWLSRKINVSFEDIKVNVERKVFDGTVSADSKDGATTSIEVEMDSAAVAADFSFCEMAPNPALDSAAQQSPQDTSAAQAPQDTSTAMPPTDTTGLAQQPTPPVDTSAVSNAASTVGTGLFHNIEGSVLPIGVKPDNDSVKYTVFIHKMTFFPNKPALLDAVMRASIPGINYKLKFHSKDIPFHPGGMSGESRLQLSSNLSLPLQGKFRLNILGQNGKTFVSWDCNGFKQFSIDASVDICPSIIVPVKNDMTADTTSYVTASFSVSVEDLESMVVELAIQPFQVRRLPGFVWSVDRAVFDFSDTYTPTGMQFPLQYNHPDVSALGVPGKLWQGFYMKSARVKLPDAITQDTTNVPAGAGSAQVDTQLIQEQVRTGITIGVENLVIDYTGFSGAIFGTDLLTLEEGKIGTWRMSVDSIAISVKQNIPNGGGFAGQIRIPMFDSTTLGYQAFIMPMTSQYLFAVDVKDQMVLKSPAMGGSSFIIDKNSKISVEYTEKLGFIAKAVLNGTATFTTGVKGDAPPGDNTGATGGASNVASSGVPKDSLKIHGISFQGLELSTKEPYLKPGTWQYSSGGKQDELGAFPITINAIGFIKDQVTEEVGFVIDADVNLMKDTASGFAAGGRVMVLCNINLVDGVQKWSFSRVKVERLSLDVSGPGYAFKGRIDFFENNPVFGTGMRGAIRASFQPKIDVGAVIQFGTVNGYRYWFADAAVSFAPGVPLGPSGLTLYGFGGGAYYHMRREGFTQVTLPEPSPSVSKDSLSFDDIPTQLGQSMTGIKYVPDDKILIGIKAMVAIGTAAREVFNAELQFEISFTSAGGLNQIGFLGDARFMTPPGPDQDPALRVVLDMVYDHPNQSFHAQLDVYVSVAGGVIRGAYPRNKAGTGIIHADPKDWYIHLGTPDNRVRLALDPKGMANMKAKKAGGTGNTAAQDSLIPDIGILLTAYLDVGTIIPEFPTPFSHNPAIRSKVQAILGDIDLPNRSGNSLLANGGGIIFGATLDVIMPELTFLIFYASFEASLGFDVMLKNYGVNARCAGNEASDQPIGINGWYATGQFFAYLAGAIGLKVDIFGIKAKFEILNLAAAAVLQAKLPEPFWARGIVGGKYALLGGMIKGQCRFEFEAGKVCDIVGASQIQGVEMISSITPDENSSTEVDVFIRPQVSFNIAIGESFSLTNDQNEEVFYKPRLVEYSITDEQTKQPVEGQIEWNYSNDLLAFKPYDILPGKRKFEVRVKVQFDTHKEGEAWKILVDNQGNPEEQERTIEFTTGTAPDYIPESNIAYSYPIINQYQFLQGESSNGYLKLKQGQPYLFDVDASKWDQKALFWQDGQIAFESPVSYNSQERQVNFAIGNNMTGNKITQLSLANTPAGANVAIDANLNIVETERLTAGGGDDMSSLLVEERKLQGNIESLEITDLLTYHFRTSNYRTLSEKMNAADLSANWFNPIFIDPSGGSALTMDEFGVFYRSAEYFDDFDQNGWHNGDEQIPPLIFTEADLSTTGANWYNQLIYPYMYQHLPTSALPVNWRDPQKLGVIPVMAANIYQAGTPQRLTEAEVLNQSLSTDRPLTGIKYRVPYQMFMDHFQFKNAVNNYAVNHNLSPGLTNFINGNFVYPKYGQYKLKLHYRLPGSEEINSTVEIMIPYGISN